MADNMNDINTGKSRSMVDNLSDKTSQMGSQVSGTIGRLGDKASDFTSNASQSISETAQNAGQKISEATVQAKQYVSDKVDQVSGKLHELREVDYGQVYDNMKDQIRMHPAEAILISAAVGFGLGMLLRGRR